MPLSAKRGAGLALIIDLQVFVSSVDSGTGGRARTRRKPVNSIWNWVGEGQETVGLFALSGSVVIVEAEFSANLTDFLRVLIARSSYPTISS